MSEEESGCPYKADGLDNCDAVVWARKFCETAETLGHAGLDEAWVAGWFANAMGAVEWYHPEIKRMKADQRTARDVENEYLRQMLINAIPRPEDSQAMSDIRTGVMQSIANVVLPDPPKREVT